MCITVDKNSGWTVISAVSLQFKNRKLQKSVGEAVCMVTVPHQMVGCSSDSNTSESRLFHNLTIAGKELKWYATIRTRGTKNLML